MRLTLHRNLQLLRGAAFATACTFAVVCQAPPSAAEEGGLITPADVAPPAASSPPPAGSLEIGAGSTSAMPAPPAAKVAKKDEPRTDEPMDSATEFFEKKVFSVPDGKGKTITYFFKPPAPYQPKDKLYPLVLVLHDEDGLAPAAQYLIQKAARKTFPAYIAVPVLAPGRIWAFPAKMDDKKLDRDAKKPQELDDILKLVSDLADEYATLDINRIYVVGCGQGAFGVFGAAAKYSQVFAGGVPISGGWALKDAGKLTRVPMFVMAGAEDKEIDPGVSQNLAYYIQQSGGKRISFMAIPGMEHDCANPYLYNNAVWAWLFKQRK